MSSEFTPKPEEGSLISKLASAFGGQIGAFLFGFLAQMILAQNLGAAGKGAFSLVILIVVLIHQFIHGSFESANSHFTGRFPESGPSIVGNSLLLALVTGLTVTVLFRNNAEWILARTYPDVDLSLVKLTLLTLTPLLLLEYSSGIVRGQDRIGRSSFILAVRELLFVAGLAILLLVEQLTVGTALALWVTTAVVVALFAFWSAWSGMRFQINLNFPLYVRMWKYAVQGHTANLTGFLRMRLDMFILALYLDMESIGYYSITFAIIQLLAYLPRAVSQVLVPHISWRQDSAGDRITPILCRTTFFVSFLCGLGMIALGYPVIVFVFGIEFAPAYMPLVVMVPGAVVHTLATSLAGDLAGRGKPQYAMKISAVMLVMNVAVNFALIPTLGMIGAAIAASVTQAVAGLLFLLAFRKESGVPLLTTLIVQRDDVVMLVRLLKG